MEISKENFILALVVGAIGGLMGSVAGAGVAYVVLSKNQRSLPIARLSGAETPASPLAASGSAALQAPIPLMFKPCEEDIGAFCGDVPHKQEQLIECLGAHLSNLSEKCAQRVRFKIDR